VLTQLLDQALADLQPGPGGAPVRVCEIVVDVGLLRLVYEDIHGRHETAWYGFGAPTALAQADGDPGDMA
jgi:hypothetical protein